MGDPAESRRDRAAIYRRDGWWNDDTLTSLLERQVAGRPDYPAIVWADGTLSYAELAERVDQVARGIAALGIAKGDVVSIQLPNMPEFVAAFDVKEGDGMYLPPEERVKIW